MFLTKKYILANELVEKMQIKIANISILRKQFEDADDFVTVINMNNCNFIKSTSHKLPNNIQKGISDHKFTDFSNKLPCTWVHNEFSVNEKEWFDSGIVIDKIVICKKKFYVFSDDFISKVNNCVPYVLNKAETEECLRKNQIDGSIQLSKNKFMTWYNPRNY